MKTIYYTSLIAFLASCVSFVSHPCIFHGVLLFITTTLFSMAEIKGYWKGRLA